MQPSTVSPLAQKLAESHEVDLAAVQATNPAGTITARNVLDFLNLTADEEAAVRRRAERKTRNEEAAPEAIRQGDTREGSDLSDSARGSNEKSDEVPGEYTLHPDQDKNPDGPHPEPEAKTQVMTTENRATENRALDQASAQLKATAMVHQKALMQVGMLRHENEALDYEVERLRLKEAKARDFINELEQKKQELERELENSKKRSARFAWLRRMF